MGEAKRRKEAEAKRVAEMNDFERLCYEAEKKLMNEGLYIKAGWVGLKAVLWPDGDVSPVQEREMEKAFFAGALHLLTGLTNTMDPDKEPTAADMRRMELIHKELETFGHTLYMDLPTEGNA